MNILLGALAMLCGVILTAQVGSNAALGKELDNPFLAAAINMAVGLVLTTLVVLVVAKPWPSAGEIRGVPWWAWFGGLLGTGYLIGNILLAPKLGAAVLVGAVVSGQLLFAVLADHFGWLGFEQHSAHLGRIAGCLLMVAGVALIAKY